MERNQQPDGDSKYSIPALKKIISDAKKKYQNDIVEVLRKDPELENAASKSDVEYLKTLLDELDKTNIENRDSFFKKIIIVIARGLESSK